jgi:MoxR-like ATPase
VLAAKALALLDGRTAPTTTDIKTIAVPVLRHRIIVNHRAVGDGVTAEQVVERLVGEI